MVHPSLLPKYRGACPIQHAILNGESQIGVSLIETSKNAFDQGRVLAQRRFPLTLSHKFSDMTVFLAEEGAGMVGEVLPQLEKYREQAWAQDEREASKAPLIKDQGDFGRLRWER